MRDPSRLRRSLVKAAGRHRQPAWIACAISIEMERSYAAFRDAMSARLYGPPPKLPRDKVSVPRALRRMFGRYVEVARHGRPRKDRRKHNRRWMPEQDNECDC